MNTVIQVFFNRQEHMTEEQKVSIINTVQSLGWSLVGRSGPMRGRNSHYEAISNKNMTSAAFAWAGDDDPIYPSDIEFATVEQKPQS